MQTLDQDFNQGDYIEEVAEVEQAQEKARKELEYIKSKEKYEN